MSYFKRLYFLINNFFVFLFLKCKRVSVNFSNLNGANFWVKINNKGKFIIKGNISYRTKGRINISSGILTIGDNVFINNNFSINVHNNVYIGNNVIIGESVKIYDHDHDYKCYGAERFERFITKPIVISDGVWLGSNVIILKGVEIGENSVVAAGSVLTKNVPKNSIYINGESNAI